MITKRDREIINFIYAIGYLSIDQCSKLFFSDRNYAYDLARKRLKKISEQADYIKPILNAETKQTIYVPKEVKIKKISKHDLLLLDYLAELKVLGVEVEKVELVPDLDGAIPDMFIKFTFDGYRYYQFVEMQLRHDFVDIEKFNKPGVISKIYELTNNTRPRLVIIQDTKKDYNKDNPTAMKIIQLNTNLDGLMKVLM